MLYEVFGLQLFTNHERYLSLQILKVIGTGRRLKLRIGQRRGLSTIDISQLRDMYKCNQRQDRQETGRSAVTEFGKILTRGDAHKYGERENYDPES